MCRIIVTINFFYSVITTQYKNAIIITYNCYTIEGISYIIHTFYSIQINWCSLEDQQEDFICTFNKGCRSNRAFNPFLNTGNTGRRNCKPLLI